MYITDIICHEFILIIYLLVNFINKKQTTGHNYPFVWLGQRAWRKNVSKNKNLYFVTHKNV